MRILLATLLHLAVAAALAAAVPPGPRCQGADGEPRLAGGWSPLAAKSAIPRKQVFPALVRFLKDSYEGEFEFEVCNGPSLTLDAACSQVVAGRNLQVVSTLTCPDRQPIKIQATLHLPLGEQPVEVIEFDAWQQPLKERRLPPRPVR